MSDCPRILYIDNEESWQNTIKSFLSDYDIETVSTVADAINKLSSRVEYDIALINMNLINDNDNSGKILLDYICLNHPSLPRIVLSGGIIGDRIKHFIKQFDLFDYLEKKGPYPVLLREAIQDAIQQRFEVKVKQVHSSIPRYILHLYQEDVLRSYSRLQLFEFYIEGKELNPNKIFVEFQAQSEYVQKTRYCLLSNDIEQQEDVKQRRFFLSPIFTDKVRFADQIAISDISVWSGEECIWKSDRDQTYRFRIDDTVPILLKKASVGDSWTHFLITACITPNSSRVKQLAREVRQTWGQDHPGETWRASQYTAEDALSVIKYLRELLKGIVCESIYIPNLPENDELVSHHMRLPDEVLENGGANCLYYSLLYSSVMENLGLHPILLFTPGHVIPGWKKTRSTKLFAFGKTSLEELMDNCVFLESTYTSSPEINLKEMTETGRKLFKQACDLYKKNQSVYLLDVAYLRRSGITPYRE